MPTLLMGNYYASLCVWLSSIESKKELICKYSHLPHPCVRLKP